MKSIIVATKNEGKMKEFKDFFNTYGLKAISLLELSESIPDIQETGDTFSENAALKAEAIANHLKRPVLADDSGLVIDALGGKPGVYSARYAGEYANDQENVDKVLREMQDIPPHNRSARFICVLAIAQPDEKTIFKEGSCEGTIAFKPMGDRGFGYDPIFIPKGYTKTMAELPSEEKNKISHRKNAFNRLKNWLKTISG
ncbi:MAG TPA: XTP/dITP diphosphatase [Bacillota bacterium]|nr:XTP/dITP diphosphatase [Bacillota bacterium]